MKMMMKWMNLKRLNYQNEQSEKINGSQLRIDKTK